MDTFIVSETPDIYFVLGCQLQFSTRLASVKDGTRKP